MSTALPTLVVDLTQTETFLRLRWTAVNRASDPLYLCVRTNIGDEIFALPYTYLRENDSVLAMTFRDIPIPPGMNVYSADIPFYRMLEQGQSVTEAVEVPVPVREVHPYCEQTYPDNTVLVYVTKIAFSVEYLWCRDKYSAYPTPHDPELVMVRGSQHHLLEKLFELQKPMIVAKRLDEFYRY
jgi:hypothetical protein